MLGTVAIIFTLIEECEPTIIIKFGQKAFDFATDRKILKNTFEVKSCTIQMLLCIFLLLGGYNIFTYLTGPSNLRQSNHSLYNLSNIMAT